MGGRKPSRWLLMGWAAANRRAALRARLEEIGAEPGHGPRPEFRARLREELAGHPAGTAGAETARHRRRGARRLRPRPAALLVTAAALTAVTGLQTYTAVPGDRLYPIKRATEATLLSLTTNDVERAHRELTVAHSRATEAAALLGYPDSTRARLIGPTLDEMAVTTRSALTALSHVKREKEHSPTLRRFSEEQRDVVGPMIPLLTDDDAMKASAYLDMIDRMAP
ncbi:hypothetical protein Sru01_62920 [Sphaerisporangium rufum]|uniref:DUF5667 domain-containing protein n=1 Tax=Sphaerisporangium rufum TaxID=1381558 RepID=A0A919RAT3_9ACTN|nr:DUF5667 domain-containing protein [Sphaerisporangium rufum]GII81310.1 hypothetical protein Sru01_62920 [Sphaerisporangium rufum]